MSPGDNDTLPQTWTEPGGGSDTTSETSTFTGRPAWADDPSGGVEVKPDGTTKESGQDETVGDEKSGAPGADTGTLTPGIDEPQ